jgi:16S rRNA (cytidine1402-2'-O)-methyltransferase
VDAPQPGEGPGRLLVCGTPIGNLGDVTPRLRETLAATPVIACEDTRRTRALLSALGVPTPRLLSYRSDNEQASARGVVEVLLGGNDVALVTDAGMPAISDPGAELVARAHEAGIEVVVVPGPSALDAALAASGARGSRMTFVSFLPRSAQAVRDLVEEHAGCVLVAFESPQRVAASLAAIAEVQPGRTVTIARELTKRHEQVRRGRASDLAAEVAAGGEVKGEHVLVHDAEAAAPADGVAARDVALVQALVEEGVRMRTACKLVAAHAGVRVNALHAAATAGQH